MNEIYRFSNFCLTCNSIVEFEKVHSYKYNEEQHNEVTISGTKIILSKCLNCYEPLLQKDFFYFQDDDYWSNGNHQLYPKMEISCSEYIPEIIQRPYLEALKCYKIQAYDACVIMTRKGIEALCINKGVPQGKLIDMIKKLENQQIISKDMYNWANELRILGNDGAHSHNQLVTQNDAKYSIEFLEALIVFLFDLTAKYEKLLNRKNGN